MRLQNIIILPIKVDRIKDDATVAQHEQIRKFVTGCSRRPDCLHLGRVQIRCGRTFVATFPFQSETLYLEPQGLLRVGDEIEVHRGIVSKEEEGKTTCIPIVSLCVKKNDLQFAVRGGPTGVGTHIDPTLMRSDRLHQLGMETQEGSRLEDAEAVEGGGAGCKAESCQDSAVNRRIDKH